MLHDLFSLFRNGEIIPSVLLAIVCISYIVIIERFILLQMVYKINFEKYNSQLKRMLQANDTDRARALSKSTSGTGVPMLAVKAIDAYEFDPMQVRSTLSEECLRFIPRLRRRLNQLPSLATASILLGSIAAVHGVWESFKVIEGLELGIKSAAFASQLTHALLPLSISLLAAFLIMLPYGVLDAIASRLETEIEHSLCIIINLLSPEMRYSLAHAGGRAENKTPLLNSQEDSSHAHALNNSHNTTEANYQNSLGKAAGDDKSVHFSEKIPDEEEII